jgi:hypothetical protein
MHRKCGRPNGRRSLRGILIHMLIHGCAVLSGIAAICILALAAFRRADPPDDLKALMA